MGEIGAAVRGVLSIGMSIHYFNRSRRSSVEQTIGAATYHDSLESLLKTSDCILFACFDTSETRQLSNRKILKMMKRGSKVVNIGCGKCINEDSASALEDGHVSSAGLDV